MYICIVIRQLGIQLTQEEEKELTYMYVWDWYM